jgi:hypothetical protein
MNLNRNRRWENFDLDVDPSLCDFFEALVSELEAISPPGPAPTNRQVEDAFSHALSAASCGDVYTAQASRTERLALLGFTRAQIHQILETDDAADPFAAGAQQLEEKRRAAILSEALGGNMSALKEVEKWTQQQQQQIYQSEDLASLLG